MTGGAAAADLGVEPGIDRVDDVGADVGAGSRARSPPACPARSSTSTTAGCRRWTVQPSAQAARRRRASCAEQLGAGSCRRSCHAGRQHQQVLVLRLHRIDVAQPALHVVDRAEVERRRRRTTIFSWRAVGRAGASARRSGSSCCARRRAPRPGWSGRAVRSRKTSSDSSMPGVDRELELQEQRGAGRSRQQHCQPRPGWCAAMPRMWWTSISDQRHHQQDRRHRGDRQEPHQRRQRHQREHAGTAPRTPAASGVHGPRGVVDAAAREGAAAHVAGREAAEHVGQALADELLAAVDALAGFQRDRARAIATASVSESIARASGDRHRARASVVARQHSGIDSGGRLRGYGRRRWRSPCAPGHHPPQQQRGEGAAHQHRRRSCAARAAAQAAGCDAGQPG